MATAVSHPRSPLPEPDSAPERVVLYDVSWEAYDTLVEEIGERNVHLTYDEGTLEIMTLSTEHESWNSLIAAFIEILALELNIPMRRLGSMTSRRKDLAKGLEPDRCYYVQQESQVRGKKKINLECDPPPDLSVEVDISYHAVNRESIYAALGVPEVWRFDGRDLHLLHLSASRVYDTKPSSLCFPTLRAIDLQPFLVMDPDRDETTLIRSFRDWVRTTLMSRTR